MNTVQSGPAQMGICQFLPTSQRWKLPHPPVWVSSQLRISQLGVDKEHRLLEQHKLEHLDRGGFASGVFASGSACVALMISGWFSVLLASLGLQRLRGTDSGRV